MTDLPTLWIDERERDEAPASFDPARVEVVIDRLDHGDYVWEGQGPEGSIMLAAEHKTVQGLVHSIIATNHHLDQLDALEEVYDRSFFVVSGSVRRGAGGILERLSYTTKKRRPIRFSSTAGGPQRPRSNMAWQEIAPAITYSRYRKSLFSITNQRSTKVIEVRDFRQFVDDLTDLVEWWHRPYNSHTSATALSSPVDVREWSEVAKMAAQIDGIGHQLAQRVSNLFATPREMVLAKPEAWLVIDRVGPTVIEKIMDQLQGRGWRDLPRYQNWFKDKNKLARKVRQK